MLFYDCSSPFLLDTCLFMVVLQQSPYILILHLHSFVVTVILQLRFSICYGRSFLII